MRNYLLISIVLFSLDAHSQIYREIKPDSFLRKHHSKMLCADIDGNGLKDIISAYDGFKSADSTIYQNLIFYSNVNNTDFSNKLQMELRLKDMRIQLTELTKDTLLDVIVVGTDTLGVTKLKILRNLGNFSFEVFYESPHLAYSGDILFDDFDADGTKDIFINSFPDTNSIKSHCSILLGKDSTFAFSSTSIPSTQKGQTILYNYDDNGFPDIVQTGITDSGKVITKVYKNRNLKFTAIKDTNLTAVKNAVVAQNDFDLDGIIDLVIAGINSEKDTITEIFIRRYGNFYKAASLELHSIPNYIFCADFNNGGKADLLLNTIDSLGMGEKVLFPALTTEQLIQEENTLKIPKSALSAISCGDYNSDGSLDLFVSSDSSLSVLLNLPPKINKKPTLALKNVSVVSLPGFTFFLWNEGNDDITPSQALKYHFELVDLLNNKLVYNSDFNPKLKISRNTLDGRISNTAFSFVQNKDTSRVLGWLPIPVDNALNAGITTNIFGETGYCNIKPLEFSYSDKIICPGATVIFETPNNGEGFFFSEEKGFLGRGNSTSYTADIESGSDKDVLYAVDLQSRQVNVANLVIPDSTTKKITVTPNIICPGDSVKISIGLNGLTQKKWTSSTIVIADTSENVVLTNVLKTSTITFEGSLNEKNCIYIESDTIEVHKFSTDILPKSENFVCEGGQKTISVSGSTLTNFVWHVNDTLVNDNTNAITLKDVYQNTKIKIDAIYKDINCKVTDKFTINVVPPPTGFYFNRPTGIICKNSSVNVFPYSVSSVIDWKVDGISKGISFDLKIDSLQKNTKIQLIAKDLSLCPIQDSATLFITEPSELVSERNYTIEQYSDTTLIADIAKADFKWSNLENSILYPNDQSISVSPTKSTNYYINAKDKNGCDSKDTVFIKVFPFDFEKRFFIPDLFTPNNDKLNDEFKVYGKGVVNINFEIKDRVGNVIFKTTDKNEIMEQGWDGTKNGTPVPDGLYFWYVNGYYENGNKITRNANNTGIVHLIR